MKIYFAGSIRGGRDDVEIYSRIIKILNGYGEVLTEHLGEKELTEVGESTLSDNQIHDRDMKWLLESDLMVAEVTLIKLLDNSNFKVVAPDQRGYSPKAKPKGIDSYKIDLLAKDIIDIADVFGFESFHLVGHDWGSAVGWYIASKYPNRLLSWSALSVPHMDAFINAMEHDKIQKTKKRPAIYHSLRYYFYQRFILEYLDTRI